MYMPLLGLGLYSGHRGSKWLKDRIKIFKETVYKSLLTQTDQDFILWVSVRHEDRSDPLIREFQHFLENSPLNVVFTHTGVCFWDDKYPDDVARERLVHAVHGALGELHNVMGEADDILMTIQPSDDCYFRDMVKETKRVFREKPDLQVYGYRHGYVMDYTTGELKEWNPKTTPPFYTIRFPRAIFTDPFKHIEYTGPYKSHEYVKDFMKADYVMKRGFIVGCHGLNISTVFDHPYANDCWENKVNILSDFGLSDFKKIVFPFSVRAKIFKKLPYGVKRKLRFWAGEKRWIFRPFFAMIYNILRG